MKEYLLKMSKWCFVSAMLIGVVACSDDDSIDTSLYSGTDISSYATIKADKESKKTSIEILKEGEWKVYGGENSNSILFDEPLLQGNTRGTTELNTGKYQLYCLEWAGGARTSLGLRQLPMVGQSNFRDLGGYKTKDGRRVKWGLVFRSGKCNSLTEDDLAYLATIPLKTVIDFRSSSEQEAEPDKVPTTTVNCINYPIEPGNLSSIDVSDVIRRGDVEGAKQYLVDGNREFVISFQAEYKSFFKTLMEADKTPLMFHCTAGKDRAGFAAALFLAALGVDRETIIEDYMLTNELTGVTMEAMKALYGDNKMAECMYYISSVQKEYIEMALTTIDENYGGMDKFLVQQLGVDVEKLRKLYLY